MKKTLSIPPNTARAFLRDMERYFAEPPGVKRDEIAVLTRLDLLGHMPNGSKLRVSEVVELFYKMRNELQQED